MNLTQKPGYATLNDVPSNNALLNDFTLTERPSPPTLREEPEVEKSEAAGQDATPRYGGPSGSAPEVLRGWPILEQLPTKGAEADIYIVQAGEERCVLKLYRHRLEPKIEILNRVTEISRANRRHFVVFREAGFDEATGRWYELQEYLPLGSLRDVPSEIKQKSGFVMSFVSELAEAIHCLHANGVIHCDVKPANVLARSLEPLDLVLTDFGISSLLASDMSNKMTGLKGTPMYWAPEAFSRVVGRPCDWWGLGMIVLELLAGEHPFEGLTDSQIIHKLTIGNVEIPDSVDSRWTLLLRGLLTKDDRRRWGYDEVIRWLEGERGIPVFYEAPAPRPRRTVKNPYHLGKKYCFTAEELALELAEDPNAWFAGVKTLRGIRQWLEGSMMFDEAARLGNDIAALDIEHALFRFVHTNAKCPFSVMGKIVGFDELGVFLRRTAGDEAGPAERRVVEMTRNGQLLSFYDEYIKISGGPRDLPLYNILLLLDKKALREQQGYFEALKTPDDCLWPDDANTADTDGVLNALRKIGVVPLKRRDVEQLEKKFVLPAELLSLFRYASTYATGVEWLNLRRVRELLIPRETHFAGDEDLSLDEYDRVARARCLGHTPAMLKKLDRVREAFAKFPLVENDLWKEIFSRTVERLDSLKMQKIIPLDAVFISKADALFQERRKIVRVRLTRFTVSAICGGSAFYLLRLLTGMFSTYNYPMSFVFGALASGAFYHGLDRRALSRNAESVLDACGSYCASAAREEAERESMKKAANDEDSKSSSRRWFR